jgi:hypothetical protein
MANQNRIDATSVATSVPRQTPHTEFGSVLAQTMGNAMSGGAALAGGVMGMNPVTSAAVSGLRAVASKAAVGPDALTSVTPVTTPIAPVPNPGAGLSPIDPNAPAGSLLQQVSLTDPSSAAFLQLQMQMQAESQQFSAASNVLKVRSDSAKAAINNIR